MTGEIWRSPNGLWSVRGTEDGNRLAVSDGKDEWSVEVDLDYGVTWSPSAGKVPKYVREKVESLLSAMVDGFWIDAYSNPFYVPNRREFRDCPRCGSHDVVFLCDEVQTDVDRWEDAPPAMIMCESCLLCTSESGDTDALLREWNGSMPRFRYDEDTGRPVPRATIRTTTKSAWSKSQRTSCPRPFGGDAGRAAKGRGRP